MSHPSAAVGWYTDPVRGEFERWWDGTQWSGSTRPFGVPSTAGPAIPIAETAPLVPPVVRASVAPYRPASPASVYTQPLGYGGLVAPPIGVWRSPVDNRPYVRGMGDAAKVVFAKYAAFEGRASRPEYWYWTLLNAIIAFAAIIAMLIPFVNILVYLALIAWGLGTLVPNLAVSVRRLRDAGYHWGWLFLSLVPGGGIAVIVLSAMPSKHP